jgi:integrase family protein with SAM-like domain
VNKHNIIDPVARHLSLWQSSARDRLNKSTVAQYKREVQRFFATVRVQLAKVDDDDVSAYVARLRESAKPKASSALRSFFSHLKLEGAISHDPTTALGGRVALPTRRELLARAGMSASDAARLTYAGVLLPCIVSRKTDIVNVDGRHQKIDAATWIGLVREFGGELVRVASAREVVALIGTSVASSVRVQLRRRSSTAP